MTLTGCYLLLYYELLNANNMLSAPCLNQKIATAIVGNTHINSRQIKVRTSNGRVVLCGTADSWFEKQMAQEALRGIEGITQIENLLKVVGDE